MIFVYLSPIYIAANVFLVWLLIKFLKTLHRSFDRAHMKAIVGVIFAFFAGSIGIAFVLPHSQFERFMKRLANLWLGVEMYIGCFVLLALLGWLLFVRKRSKNWDERKKRMLHRIFGIITVLLIAGVSAYGAVHAHQLKTTTYEIEVDKSCAVGDELNIVFVSDLHLGYNAGVPEMEDMVRRINSENADLVIIGGDFFDNEYDALDDPDELISVLQTIKSKYGVYAVYGNHDIKERLLAGFTFSSSKKESDPRMDEFVEKAGITLLRDEVTLVADSFYLIGRADYEKPGRGIDKRADLPELMEGLDTSKPIIVIDHEPVELHETAAAGVDIDLNGHTHDGQLFPASIITDLVWENSYGYQNIDGMHDIVTSGVGLFGPDMRVLTDAEVAVIKVKFKN